MIKWIETTGRSEEDAISAAMFQLGLDRDDVSVEVIERAKSGFLGFGSNPAKVRVSYEVRRRPVWSGPAASRKRSRAGARKSPARRRKRTRNPIRRGSTRRTAGRASGPTPGAGPIYPAGLAASPPIRTPMT